ncbi:Fe-S oxidoreductase [Microbacterium sp. NPDC091313]
MIAQPPEGWRDEAERALARGRVLENLIPGPLLDSPVSLAGYVYGTLVGFVWGGLWSTGRVERREGMWIFRGMPRWTFPRGGTTVGACFLTGDAPVTRALLRHELVHARQWRRFGMLMPLLYAIAGRDPLRNRFEIEAGLADGNYVPRDADRPPRS